MRQTKPELVPTQVRIAKTSLEEADRIAARLDVSRGHVVRLALREFLSRAPRENILAGAGDNAH